jgi:alginate O-acetyltransferase complex protein AlgI
LVFSSLVFLLLFLPAFLLLYYACPSRWRNMVALAGSMVFYAWGAPRFILVLLGSCLLDYLCARKIESAPHRTRRLIILAVVFNVLVLVFFKYANFFVAQLDSLLGAAAHGGAIPWKPIALPIGISFFTFQKISYLIDVYRGRVEPARSYRDYVLYVSLFPQLIAGPIVRYHDVADQIRSRICSSAMISDGFRRFTIGLAKKVLIANHVGEVADTMFNGPPLQMSCVQAWVGLLCYSFQIYFDFSGYSDMAIGLGRLLGFKFLENFNRPYMAASFTDFWRRWHISLSNWMREYLYIPLGGNRVSHLLQVRNLWIVFLVSGFWHGASWNFIAWGAYHGFFLSLERITFVRRVHDALPRLVRTLGTFVLVSIGWCFFRAEDLSGAWAFLMRLFACGNTGQGLYPTRLLYYIVSPRIAVAFVAACLLSFWPARATKLDLECSGGAQWGLARLVGANLFTIVLLAFSLGALATQAFNPFIYFRF